jgi:hypothetical protein
MKKSMLLSLVTAGIAISSINVCLATNSDYPASDFQPKVVFLDTAASSNSGNQTAFDPKYPASSFQPKVVFIDKSAVKSSSNQTAFDPKYPAASFQPKVIYP